MGLDTSHDCFHGPYSQFMRWRIFIAKQVGIPLLMMDGFVAHYVVNAEVEALGKLLGRQQHLEPYCSCMTVLKAMSGFDCIKWQGCDPLEKLLNHSDCGGRIKWFDCRLIALRLLYIMRKMENDTVENLPARGCYDGMYNCTKRFAIGLLLAYKSKEDVILG